MEVLLISGFVLGFAGSVHCIGMCGPLALSLPFQVFKGIYKWVAVFFYHIGRVFTYIGIGLAAGLLGRGANWFGLTQTISIVLGLIIVFSVLLPRLFPNTELPFLKGFKQWQIQAMQKIMQKQSAGWMFVFGLLNGLLPCGLVYTAVAASLVAHNVYESMLFMGFFGMGTIPAMILLVAAAQYLPNNIRNQFRKLVPVFTFIIGCLLILRGLNLDIPFVSPYLNSAIQGTDAIHCSH
jgi:sulfite exporter TauE/SafE